MKEPTLKFQTFIYEGENSGLHDLCTLQLQYFTPEQTYDLFEHEYVKRYDTHFYRKIGEKNCREDTHKVLFSTEKDNMGYIFSMAKSIAENGNYKPNDHLVVTFSGYGEEPCDTSCHYYYNGKSQKTEITYTTFDEALLAE